MQELICIETSDWELTISCQNLDIRQKTYFEMLKRRGDKHIPNALYFKPEINLQSVRPNSIFIQESENIATPLVEELSLPRPIFFENTQYQFEWVFFNDNVDQASIAHPLKTIANSFRFAAKRKHSAASLIGTINTGNDIGKLSLPLTYQVESETKSAHLILEVLPTKMQLHSDLPAMYRCIDKSFPLWRFSLAEKTEQDAAKSQHRGNFPLLWLAQFKVLREQLESALKVISNSPHSRLKRQESHIKADRLKGKLGNKLAERVREDIKNKQYDKRYQQDKKYLSVDTPENRFIKMVVIKCKQQLEQLTQKLEKKNNESRDTSQRLSVHFITELRDWQKPLARVQKQSFLKEVGEYVGLHRESLVLQQKTGYSAVYKTWQELKYYLDIFSRHSTISMKSVAETYEVWCFLTVRQMLITNLGFEEVQSEKSKLKLNDYFELQLEDGLSGAGAFTFKRTDGLKARLAHEPIFRKNGKNIRSFGVTQKPDILLEITFPDGKKCIWLFDAKYRIKTINNRYDDDDIERKDFVPDDAINQMHRYRDALIHINLADEKTTKSRPVFGAFALYPGFYDQKVEINPYDETIKEVGIGAFALLPSDNGDNNNWLESFLIEQLGSLTTTFPVSSISDSLYVNEASRIPYYGMKQVLHSDLVLTAKLGENRTHEYIEGFKSGHAKWYHMPMPVFDVQFGHHIAAEICYIAISYEDSGVLKTDKAYRVRSVKLKSRSEISGIQAGVMETQVGDDEYWLFELGEVLTLPHKLINPNTGGFRQSLKLTTLPMLKCTSDFNALERVYLNCVV
ncbi:MULTISPECIES: restriction endonuclease-like protein [unclassified Pseudoalteromonas]|uniref:restriction endonuclease-like protein n=1 Tax=unclassified Pseudoalteromonas TaxID=194690 RepID=UPI0005A96A14|nr:MULTISPECIES: restriction endonuclease-like protein [unclassified Pseudoalteromonas]